MATPRSVTQPSYFRTGVNAGGSDIGPNLLLKPGAAAGEVAAAAAASDQPAGASVETIHAGLSQSYQVEGLAVVKAGAAVSAHARVTSDASGRAVTAATGNLIHGRAMTAAAGADELIEVELWKGRFVEP